MKSEKRAWVAALTGSLIVVGTGMVAGQAVTLPDGRVIEPETVLGDLRPEGQGSGDSR